MIFRKNMRFALLASAATAAFAAPMAVEAQEISSAIRGQIVDVQGNGVAGAEVTITHVPTGTRTIATSNAGGAYQARGLRPGGPYIVEVKGSSQYAGQRLDGIELQVSQALSLNIPLAAAGDVEEIAITATRIAAAIRGAGATSYGSADAENLPSISRDFKDLLRQNPFVRLDRSNDSISIAGANNRFNSITVNGVAQNDVFGLNASGVPTQRTPISIDAISQVGVSPAPYDVENGSFTGGQVNIVTKSGTNEFHGSIFYQYKDDSLVGDRAEGRDIPPGDFKDEFYGGSLGGPIIKDKLFFYFNYEKFETSAPNTFGFAGANIANPVTGVTQADFDEISQIASSVYGFNLLGIDTNAPLQDKKYYAQIDWNINDQHRAMISYQNTDGSDLRFTGNSTSARRLADSSQFYNRSEKVEVYNAQLFSDWTDNFSTEVKLAYTDQTTGQNSLGDLEFGSAEVDLASGSSIIFGPDEFRQANALENKTYQFKLQGDYLAGNHNISAGYEYTRQEVFNLFVPRSQGVFEFSSVEDFRNRQASTLRYSNAPTGDANDGAAEFELDTHTLYVQDSWEVNENLTLTGGLRFETLQSNDVPALNQNFVDRNGFTNQATLDGRHILMPRFQFAYQIDDVTRLTGGAGLFSGGSPLVWISNGFSTDGVTVGGFEVRRSSGAPEDVASFLDGVDLRNLPADIDARLSSSPSSTVNALDPEFDLPSVWKFSLGIERFTDLGFLGDDWRLSVEAILTETKDAVLWRELRRSPVGIAPDGAPIYNTQSGDDILLTNTTKGNAFNLAVSASKSWEHFDFAASYTFSDVEDVNPGTSSTASSSYNFPIHTDRNNLTLGTSFFETRHNVNLSLTYKEQFFGDNTTTVSLFYNGRSGRPYSLTFDQRGGSGVFGQATPFGGSSGIDGGDSHLFYVPESNEVGIFGVDDNNPNVRVLLSGVSVEELNAFIDRNDLKRGASSVRNQQQSNWVDSLDLRFSQELPVPYFGKLELWMDMENVLNFIDNSWGTVTEATFENIPVADVGIVTVDGVNKFVYGDLRDGRLDLRQQQSRWEVQFGIRYKF